MFVFFIKFILKVKRIF